MILVPEDFLKLALAILLVLSVFPRIEATELSVSVAEDLMMGEEESGWIWCTNKEGQSGRVPADHVERLP